MALLYIPLRQNQDQRATDQEVTFDVGAPSQVRVRLRAHYIAVSNRWALDFRDLADALIVGGVAAVAGIDLLLPYKHLALPQGELFLLDTRQRLSPDVVTLDVSSLLVYREVV